ncbi:Glutamate--tRNA ligase [Mycoplasmopsis californica]|uniref:Glutamate--tRNA ligase n=1 Tax=Mycoplasmopsis equigenitalium TaxID=114883 RepID=A0ABY5J0X1_9BACT|nr:glutamate--tRNA ligase [Mycoplasmopsis equigenitalium]UUD36898.1 glutamate--tRNA ligase [Mycoplasmopsis equigenitalium]VEU69807.1 Glutamate--tRNA ligase [Mycoplasmopsis californica]
MKKIRTRYAPSPTGYLHIGGARTALFSYLFAKHFKGTFVIRTEDTDQKRDVKDGEKSQLENLAWLGIIADEDPLHPNPKYGKYRQSEKLDRYNEVIDEMLKKDLVYKAYDNSEELEAQKQEQLAQGITSFRYDSKWLKISDAEKAKREKAGDYSIRFRVPQHKIYKWNDLVRGEIEFNSDEISDFVIKKSDGFPTYNFAVVVDDHDMQITHILRGEEHIANTPKQLAIYDVLKWDVPEFGHLTIITNMEGKKLSKRDLSLKQFIEDYKNEGYVPEAVFNFLALLGWTDAESKEIMSHKELIERFDYKRLSKSPSKFDITKMQWFSKQYLKQIDDQILAKSLVSKQNKEWKLLFIETYKDSVFSVKELQEKLSIYDDHKIAKFDIENFDDLVIKEFKKSIENQHFTVENIKKAISDTQAKTGIKGKNLFMPIRLATTNQQHGPELAKAIYLFGEKTIKERLKLWK